MHKNNSNYETGEIIEDVHSPQNTKKRYRRKKSCDVTSASNDWRTMNEGFAGFHLQNINKNAKMKTKRSTTPKTALKTVCNKKKLSILSSSQLSIHSNSQPSIHWDSSASDEDDTTTGTVKCDWMHQATRAQYQVTEDRNRKKSHDHENNETPSNSVQVVENDNRLSALIKAKTRLLAKYKQQLYGSMNTSSSKSKSSSSATKSDRKSRLGKRKRLFAANDGNSLSSKVLGPSASKSRRRQPEPSWKSMNMCGGLTEQLKKEFSEVLLDQTRPEDEQMSADIEEVSSQEAVGNVEDVNSSDLEHVREGQSSQNLASSNLCDDNIAAFSSQSDTRSDNIESDLWSKEKKKASVIAECLQKALELPSDGNQSCVEDFESGTSIEPNAVENNQSNLVPPPDSCRKKKAGNRNQYVKDGLADRLQRLRLREKSAHRFWAHGINSRCKQDMSQVLRVSVLHCEVTQGLLLCHCLCLSHQLHKLQFKVLFSGPVAQQINPGSLVHIHPPWQKLSLGEEDTTVILCTRYTDVIRKDHSTENTMSQALELQQPATASNIPQLEPSGTIQIMTDEEEFELIMDRKRKLEMGQEVSWQEVTSWDCPCQRDDSMSMKHCPMDQAEFIQYQPIPSNCGYPSCHSFQHLLPTPADQEHLQTVEACSPSAICGSKKLLKADILRSVEQQGSTGLPCSFVATVQRVNKRRVLSPHSPASPYSTMLQKEQISLILQDKKGVVCELQVPQPCTLQSDWSSLIESGQGQVYAFTKVKVVQRTNKARCPGLFSMIENIWSPELCSQGTTQSDDSQTLEPQAPTFCYLLKAVLGESKVAQSQLQSISYRAPVFSDNVPEGEGRCSIYGTVAYIHTPVNSSDKSPTLYLLVKSGHLIKLQETGTFFYCTCVMEIGSQLKIIDALSKINTLLLDGYSYVTMPTNQNETDDNFYRAGNGNMVIPGVNVESQVGDIVTVKGLVSGVYEETACSWLECNYCGNDKLVGGTSANPFLLCNSCRKSVSDPVTRMRLQVSVMVAENQKFTVGLELHQRTIEMLLPQDENADEGYEMSSVLNKPIGPLSALILQNNSRSAIFKRDKKKQGVCHGDQPVFHLQEVELHSM